MHLCCVQLAWTSFHNNKKMVRKHLARYHIGKISPEQKAVRLNKKRCLTQVLHVIFLCCLQLQPIDKDFMELREKMEAKAKRLRALKQRVIHNCSLFLLQGYFKTNPLFFIAHFTHIILFYIAAWAVIWNFGTGWIPWLSTAALATVSQVYACMSNCSGRVEMG